MVDLPVNILLQIKDAMSSALSSAKTKVLAFDESLKGAAKKSYEFSDAMKYASGILIADFVRGISNAFTESLSLGAQLDSLQSSFNAMQASADRGAVSLEQLQHATEGTVANVDLLKQANQAMALGLPTDQLDKLFGAAMKLGRAMGIDTLHAVESLATGIGRQSRLVLDNLGITFKAEDAYKAYAKQLGVTVSQLDESQKRLAWQEYAMQQVVERAEALGDVQDDAITAQEQWNAGVKNMTTSLGDALGPLARFKGLFDATLPIISAVAIQAIPVLIAQHGLAGIAALINAKAHMVLNAVLHANPIMLVVVAIAALVAAFIWAYNNVKPFKDAVDALGRVLIGGLKAGFEAIGTALRWVWDNVFVPFGKFIVNVFIAAWEGLKRVWDAVVGAFRWAHEHILKPLADFFRGVLKAAFDIVLGAVNALLNAWNTLVGIGSAIVNTIGSIIGALGNLCFRHATPHVERFNESLIESSVLTRGLSRELGDLRGDLIGVAGSPTLAVTAKAGGGGVPSATQTVTVYANPTITFTGSVSAEMDMDQIVDAVDEGIAKGSGKAVNLVR